MTIVPIPIVRVTNLSSTQVDPNRTLDLHYRNPIQPMPAKVSAARQKAITTTGVSTMPRAYVIAAETISDEVGFAQYGPAVPPTVSTFGGKFIVRGGNFTNLEGEWPHPRLVIIEFPSRDAAEGWYNSPAYQDIISLRHKSSVGNLIIIDGHE